MRRTKISELLKTAETDIEVGVEGLVRTRRGSKQVSFIALNDVSTINNLQIVADNDNFDEATLKRITTGAAISVNGKTVASKGSGQAIEVQASNITILGDCDPEVYPLQPKK